MYALDNPVKNIDPDGRRPESGVGLYEGFNDLPRDVQRVDGAEVARQVSTGSGWVSRGTAYGAGVAAVTPVLGARPVAGALLTVSSATAILESGIGFIAQGLDPQPGGAISPVVNTGSIIMSVAASALIKKFGLPADQLQIQAIGEALLELGETVVESVVEAEQKKGEELKNDGQPPEPQK